MSRRYWTDAEEARLRSLYANTPMHQLETIFQRTDRQIYAKAASEIDSISDASKLLGHSKEQITKTVYRRVGEVVNPTK